MLNAPLRYVDGKVDNTCMTIGLGINNSIVEQSFLFSCEFEGQSDES
jgi:hypothetical protein